MERWWLLPSFVGFGDSEARDRHSVVFVWFLREAKLNSHGRFWLSGSASNYIPSFQVKSAECNLVFLGMGKYWNHLFRYRGVGGPNSTGLDINYFVVGAYSNVVCP